jgi:fatty acid desaturase
MPRKPALLRYAIDVWPVAIGTAAFAGSVLPLFRPLSPAALGAWWLVLFVLKRIVTAAQHGHAHLSVFHPGHRASGALNFAYDTLLGQATGLTTAEWELHHNRGHHRDYRDPAKDVFSVLDPHTGRPRSRVEYSLHSSLSCWGDSLRIAREEGPREGRDLVTRFWLCLAVQLGVMAAMVAVNPAMGLLFGAGQAFVVRCSVAWSSYWHHLDVPMTNVYDSSRTLIHPLHNFLGFNSGHHTAHHEKPTLHWSLLPERTRAILDRIPPSCIRNQDAPLAS